MRQEVSSKLVVLTFSILVLSFLAGFYVLAWQEPSQSAPNSNVAVPINTGSAAQSKTGRISAPEFYDANDSNYYLNPNGNSNLNTVCLGTDCRNAWPVAGGTPIPSGLYGICNTFWNSNNNSFIRCTGESPAYCAPGDRSACLCPSGYRLVMTGFHEVYQQSASNLSSFYSCLKL